jgi:glucose/arabinose dehydrogenase
MTRRVLVLLAAFVVAVAACGDDSGDPPESITTVPTTSTTRSTTSTEPVGSDAPTETPSTTTVPTTTTAPDGDLSQVAITVAELASLDEPIETAVAPNGEWWVAQRSGVVVVVDPRTGGIGDEVIDISEDTVAGGERGLLGMAVDDDHLYLSYTDRSGTSHVDAYALGADRGRPTGRVALLELDQPFGNHNGGGIAIGPDGHLYIGFGDGGSANDPLGAGQDPFTWLGSILRIDPTPGSDRPYAIPADNPFADGTGGLPEIFLTGARNPWRFSFDAHTDDLWVADVGQNQIEEIDLLLAANGGGLGTNLGWNLREGTTEFTGPRPEGNVDPVFEYRHGGDPGGCSVSGGHVYRGTLVPELVGSYVFGDYCTSAIWAVSVAGGEVTFRDLDVAVPGGQLVGFGVDPDGELVTLSLQGPVARIVAA